MYKHSSIARHASVRMFQRTAKSHENQIVNASYGRYRGLWIEFRVAECLLFTCCLMLLVDTVE